jgi:hypothetical protein
LEKDIKQKRPLTMHKIFHILNGDSLRQQFPKDLQGEILVTRECLVDGDVKGNGIEELFAARATFINSCYGNEGEVFYKQKVVTEFEKMQNIPEGADVNVWFEDDLFCQVNFWFVMHLLSSTLHNRNYYLVRPKAGSEYSFAGMNTEELLDAYNNRTILELSEARMIGELWHFYQMNDFEKMITNAEKLNSKFPFLLPAIQAHIDRLPSGGKPGRVTQALINIIHDSGTTEFAPVFKEFSKREPIYGFGDTQIKRLLEEIKRN